LYGAAFVLATRPTLAVAFRSRKGNQAVSIDVGQVGADLRRDLVLVDPDVQVQVGVR
jgi:hypothetical protein